MRHQGVFLSGEEGGGGNSLCTKNGPTRFSQRQISVFPAMVTLVWGRGEQA